jgi:hypothetical protein
MLHKPYVAHYVAHYVAPYVAQYVAQTNMLMLSCRLTSHGANSLAPAPVSEAQLYFYFEFFFPFFTCFFTTCACCAKLCHTALVGCLRTDISFRFARNSLGSTSVSHSCLSHCTSYHIEKVTAVCSWEVSPTATSAGMHGADSAYDCNVLPSICICCCCCCCCCGSVPRSAASMLAAAALLQH